MSVHTVTQKVKLEFNDMGFVIGHVCPRCGSQAIFSHKITDRRKMAGLSTKTILIRGYCTVIFCTARFNMEQQERTRLLLLSPETNSEKIKHAAPELFAQLVQQKEAETK